MKRNRFVAYNTFNICNICVSGTNSQWWSSSSTTMASVLAWKVKSGTVLPQETEPYRKLQLCVSVHLSVLGMVKWCSVNYSWLMIEGINCHQCEMLRLAGCGKTYTINSCFLFCHDPPPQLCRMIQKSETLHFLLLQFFLNAVTSAWDYSPQLGFSHGKYKWLSSGKVTVTEWQCWLNFYTILPGQQFFHCPGILNVYTAVAHWTSIKKKKSHLQSYTPIYYPETKTTGMFTAWPRNWTLNLFAPQSSVLPTWLH